MAHFAESDTPYQPGRYSEQSNETGFSAAEAGQQIERAATSVVATAKEYPMTTLAVAAGLAFAVGALWKAGRSQPSRWDALQARMPDIPTARQLKSYWR
jgi:hypothetical protein